jgi:L-arabinose isomerase
MVCGSSHAIGKEEQETLDDQAATIVDALRQGSYRTP